MSIKLQIQVKKLIKSVAELEQRVNDLEKPKPKPKRKAKPKVEDVGTITVDEDNG